MTMWSAAPGSDGAPIEFAMLPYSVGMLQAHAEQHARERHEFAMPIFKRMPVAEAVERLRGFDLVAFSLYVWNAELSLAIVRELRAVEPDTIIVCGGPHVPDRVEPFLRENPDVDVVCHGEGERTFTEILDASADRDWGRVSSVSFLDATGAVVSTAKRDRVGDLDTLPSPYLDGVFDKVMAEHPTTGWIMTWETNRGCPFSCTFCDWGSATASSVYRFGMDRLMGEIDWMGDHRVGFVFCCDANFGMLPRDLDIAQALVEQRQRTGFPFSLSVQNTKNARERAYQVQTLIAGSLNTLGVTISLQSANRETLTNIKRRNISSGAFEDLQRRFAADGVYTYTDLILGLPGESYDQFADGVSHVVATGQHNHVQFHNCSVLPNAEMGDPEYQRRFGMQTVRQQMLNVHHSVDEIDEIPEWLPIVVATDAMAPEAWRRAKVFAWLTDLVYFDRVLQVPLAVLSARHDIPLREFVDRLIDADPRSAPTVAAAVAAMVDHASAIQGGGIEYLSRRDAGNIWWPMDQFTLIGLVLDGTLGEFYREAERLVTSVLTARGIDESPLFVGELFDLNAAILRQPAPPTDRVVLTTHDVDGAYRSVLRGERPVVEERWTMLSVDRTSKPLTNVASWLDHLVWCYGKDKRGYLASVKPATRKAFARVAEKIPAPGTASA